MVSFARAFRTYGIITGLVVILSASSLLVHYRGLGSAGSRASSVNGREYAANSPGDSGLAPTRTTKAKRVSSRGAKVKAKLLVTDTQTNDGFGRLVYNRVGKCGSRSLITILSVLSSKNGFNFAKDPSVVHSQTRFPLPDQIALVQHVDKISPPFFYNRHFHFIDFTRFGARQPIYINMIRDPFDRLVSSYYFKRFGDGRSDDRGRYLKEEDKLRSFDACVLEEQVECTRGLHYIIPFFCGQRPGCRIADPEPPGGVDVFLYTSETSRDPSRWALERAKDNVLDKFLVVGILEEFNDTLRVFEHLLPNFFKGAMSVWENPPQWVSQLYNTSKTVKKPQPSPFIRDKMRRRMKLEYEFYYFVRDIFHNLKNRLDIPSTPDQVAYRSDPLYKEIMARKSTKLMSYAREQPVIAVGADNKDYDENENEYEDERKASEGTAGDATVQKIPQEPIKKVDPRQAPSLAIDETQKHAMHIEERKVFPQNVYSNTRDGNALKGGTLSGESFPRAETEMERVLNQAQRIVSAAVNDNLISRTSESIRKRPTPRTYDTEDKEEDDYDEDDEEETDDREESR
ncbi:uronyl 2-sulfotransferase-like isoform X1 [Branchiostoma floridae]|uniref:Uronyl 2-sulfotransferase-like isoform X1 n=1 Tax=Branchiostoma floridae TaxID=7739 RepID=A0A9J7LQ66_BRAFL|nr:uronyl 2-sulfotransferase-like isoform X1 [Branchiostoma floridae]